MFSHPELCLLPSGDPEGNREDASKEDKGIVETCLLDDDNAGVKSTESNEARKSCKDHSHHIQGSLRRVPGNGGMLGGEILVVDLRHDCRGAGWVVFDEAMIAYGPTEKDREADTALQQGDKNEICLTI